MSGRGASALGVTGRSYSANSSARRLPDLEKRDRGERPPEACFWSVTTAHFDRPGSVERRQNY